MIEIERAFNQCAELIDQYGHCNEDYGSFEEGFCMIEAMNIVERRLDMPSCTLYNEAFKAMNVNTISEWSDTHSKEQVISKFRELANQALESA